MKLILHIGMPKTGSTALQKFLAGNRSNLLKYGVLYPKVNVSQINHNFLSLFLRRNELVPRSFQAKYAGNQALMMKEAEYNWCLIKQQVDKYRPETVILSGELIFKGFEVGDLSAFKSRLQQLTSDIQIVAYVRQPSKLYLSQTQQYLKASSSFPSPQPILFCQALHASESCFGIKPSVLAYERDQLYQGNISTDFIYRLLPGLEANLDYSYSQVVNESLSPESMSIMQEYRALNHAGADNAITMDSKRLLRCLRHVESKYKLNQQPTLIEEIAHYIDHSSTELNYLADNYGVYFKDVDYSEIAAPVFNPYTKFSKVSDICAVDPERKKQILMLTLHELIESKGLLPIGLQKWIERKEGSFYIQFSIKLKSVLRETVNRLFF